MSLLLCRASPAGRSTKGSMLPASSVRRDRVVSGFISVTLDAMTFLFMGNDLEGVHVCGLVSRRSI
jgi:hypothetical protein